MSSLSDVKTSEMMLGENFICILRRACQKRKLDQKKTTKAGDPHVGVVGWEPHGSSCSKNNSGKQTRTILLINNSLSYSVLGSCKKLVILQTLH